MVKMVNAQTPAAAKWAIRECSMPAFLKRRKSSPQANSNSIPTLAAAQNLQKQIPATCLGTGSTADQAVITITTISKL
jgi:hypothetical protein